MATGSLLFGPYSTESSKRFGMGVVSLNAGPGDNRPGPALRVGPMNRAGLPIDHLTVG